MQLPPPYRVVGFPGYQRTPIASLIPEDGYCLRPLSFLPDDATPLQKHQENFFRISVMTLYCEVNQIIENRVAYISLQFRCVRVCGCGCLCGCLCVCVRERERERESLTRRVCSDRVNSLIEWYNKIFVEEFGGYRIRFVPRQAVVDRVNTLAQRAENAARARNAEQPEITRERKAAEAGVTAAVLYLARKISPANEALYPELVRRAREIDPLFGRGGYIDEDDN